MTDYAPSEEQLLNIELSEEPTCPRPDYATINFVCDENGLIEKAPGQLETRGATSHPELWSASTAHRLSIVAKLRESGRWDLAAPLADCHTLETCRVCTDCRRVTVFWNRCENHYCPTCAPRLARERAQSVEWWTHEIRQPKHVVLTVRNTALLDRYYVAWFKNAFARLRRRKFARNWHGGLYRLEVTNESQGWHLHLHALIDAGWIDARKLAEEWAKCVGQDMAIVKVKDCYRADYLHEVTKYTVKGSQLAAWDASDIATFLDSFNGVKTFGVFGSLYGKRTQWREWIDSLQSKGAVCDCGCSSFRIMSPNELAWENMRRDAGLPGHRATAPPAQPDLPDLPPVEGKPRHHWFFEGGNG